MHLDSDTEGMFAEMRANPDELTVRLIYADWLEDHGQGDRAAFIRACCATKSAVMLPKLGRMLSEHWPAWLTRGDSSGRIQGIELHTRAGCHLTCYVFDPHGTLTLTYKRGLVSDIRFTNLTALAWFGPALVRVEPLASVWIEPAIGQGHRIVRLKTPHALQRILTDDGWYHDRFYPLFLERVVTLAVGKVFINRLKECIELSPLREQVSHDFRRELVSIYRQVLTELCWEIDPTEDSHAE